nr:glycosyltransferase family 4 protein [Lewinella sp. JB7]
MHRICTTLQAAGHEVTLIGRIMPHSGPLPDRPYRQERLRCRYHVGKRFYAEFNFRLWQSLRRRTYDVVCAVDLDTLLPAIVASGRHRAVVYDAHEWFSETPEVAPRPLIRAAWRGLGRALVPRTEARYTVGETLARQLEEDYGRPFAVVRNLPQQARNSFCENSGGVILYQGMLNPGRGLDTAIRAMAEVPQGELWIVGEGPEAPRLVRLANELNLSDRVKFLGFVPPEELPAVTARAWLGLNLLADSSPSYYYSLANKALDYLQSGLPSIQMDFPEYRALQEEYHCFELLPELSAPALAARINVLAANPARYARLRRACREAARELCWEKEAPKLLAIYGAVEERLRAKRGD